MFSMFANVREAYMVIVVSLILRQTTAACEWCGRRFIVNKCSVTLLCRRCSGA
jgi:hypothetical protein